MGASDYRHQVTIEKPGGGQDRLGSPAGAWSTMATAWAAIEPLQGRELLLAQQVQSEITTRIRIRWRAGITADMRVKHGGTIYNIKAPFDPEQRRRELHLMCVQQAGEA